ncbi:FKBP-type peptidyl-prolyl isomerase-like protein [Neolewinella xylanilytica]|uniref:Peptidyl-prolyl cis-trans isomerase n=1 Tax=Neolewinella xylanilytica TaxID=1514080 RepID=A0A2S6IAT2_9BACT|nr:FKBP-type peptidyl-prolyl cis-trans isomerase [Neolewinella xylanilytica]PPK88613.1 FKBP-type peptidyl-prolyl isomerase-like protein [Neolewinella xylanilytica]
MPVFLCFLILWLSSCGPSTPPDDDSDRAPAERSAIEERLITELSPTEDLAGRQRNAIINRAIDRHYDVYVAPEGYFYEVLDSGNYNPLASGDIVSAHYTGWFLDGTQFDGSRRRGEPLRFRIGDLIPAWNLALPRVRPGARLRILTPSSLAYGTEGLVAPDGDTLVPANEPLEFLIEEITILEE